MKIVETEQKFQQFIELLPEIVFEIDLDCNLKFANSKALEKFGYTYEDLKDDFNAFNIFTTDCIARVKQNIVKITNGEYLGPNEYTAKRKDGTEFPILINTVRILDNDYNTKGLRGIIIDMSDIKNAEKELKRSQKKWMFALENAGDGIWEWNPKKDYIYYSDRLVEKYGFSKSSEQSIETWLSKMHPDDKKEATEKLEDYIDGKIDSYSSEYRIKCADGKYRWILDRGKIIKIDDYSFPETILGIHTDITERKQLEENLKKSEKNLRKVVENMPVMLDALDENNNIIVWNKECERVTGYSEKEIANNPESFTILYPNKKYLTELWKKHEKFGQNFRNLESTITCKNGTRKIISWSNISEKHPIPGWSSWAIGIDITELKEAERLIKQSLKEAQTSDQLKSTFLANMSHEIRTPLNAIIGFVDYILNDMECPNEIRTHLLVVKDSGHMLLNIINDILDLSKIEAGQMRIEKTLCSISEVFTQIHSQAQSIIKKKKTDLNLDYKINENVYDDIISDPTRLQQILMNLISNAIKFSDKGFIEFGVSVKHNKLKFYVKDTGIGIPDEQHGLIFSAFQQVDSTISRKYEGTGLGLTITKKLVKLMSGDIWFQSKKGKGSVFYFEIPYIPAKSKTVSKNENLLISNVEKGYRILLVEDNPANQLLAKKILLKHGYEVVIANDGKEAIDLYLNNLNLNLILMDIRMPNMDGLETTRLIRELEKNSDRTRIPIIALSAAAMKDDISQGLKAGCNDYLQKPLNIKKLLKTIKKWSFCKKSQENLNK